MDYDFDRWLGELRRQSIEAIKWIENLPSEYREKPSVSWSVGWIDTGLIGYPVDDGQVSNTAQALCSDLSELNDPISRDQIDLHGLGGELIERSLPTMAWLEKRTSELPEILRRRNLSIQGWAFEPTDIRSFQNYIPQAWSYRAD